MIKTKIGLFLRKIIFGEFVIKEFSTIGIVESAGEKVYLKTGDLVIDVTENQWTLGLEPLTFGFWIEKKEHIEALGRKQGSIIYFRRAVPNHPNHTERSAVALASLDFFDRIDDERGTLFLLQVGKSKMHHVNTWKARLLYWKFYKKPGFTYEKLKTIATAYSFPRRVRIISFKIGDDYNYIFPMDLLGDIRHCGKYLLGMRHSNNVLKKIMEIRKIVVAEVPAAYKPVIYKLGRNHSANPPALNELPFDVITTEQFGFHIPDWAESYKEVTIRKTIDIGSHMLLIGEWNEETILRPSTPRLHHIHFLHFLHQKKKGYRYPLV